jgi:hypothetical protein
MMAILEYFGAGDGNSGIANGRTPKYMVDRTNLLFELCRNAQVRSSVPVNLKISQMSKSST